MAKRTKLKAGCGVLGVFSAGFLFGVVVLFVFLNWIIPRSEGWKDEESKTFVTKHITNMLNLTDEQVELAKPVIYEILDRRYVNRKRYVETDIELTGEGVEKMKEFLTEEQQAVAKEKFEQWKKGKKRFMLPAEE